ncbi:MAG: hypothetical protein D6806_06170 [Deltaproteobacteria bacterium]|nr:MAG: hypothetical protein D6806_06170 [Deltaproteobacteria bacterium]
MGVQFFGEFLIDRWIITRGQLIEALELQRFRNPKFGQLAVEKGYLTEQQVAQVHIAQRNTDKRFAELAVSMGLMTQEQADEILAVQKNNHLYLGEALLELGHITEEILERELAIFKEEQAAYELEKIEIPAGVGPADTIEAAVDMTRKMLERMAGLKSKVEPGKMEESAQLDFDAHLSVAVDFTGSENSRYVLSPSSEVAVWLASAVLGQDATRESEEVVADAVKEFCNIVCGNTVAKLSQQGKIVEISPPLLLDDLPGTDGAERCLVFPVRLSEGRIDLRFQLEQSART